MKDRNRGIKFPLSQRENYVSTNSPGVGIYYISQSQIMKSAPHFTIPKYDSKRYQKMKEMYHAGPGP